MCSDTDGMFSRGNSSASGGVAVRTSREHIYGLCFEQQHESSVGFER